MKSNSNQIGLSFNKSAVVELNDTNMRDVNSGITPGVLVFYICTAMGAGVGVGAAITNL